MSISVELTYDMVKVLGIRRLELQDAPTVEAALQRTRERFGEQAGTFDRLARMAAVVVNGVLVSHARGGDTPLRDGDRVTFLKAAAGG